MTIDSDTRPVEFDPNTGPPLSWYEGFGHVGEGIRRIFYSDELLQMGDGEVENNLNTWGHFQSNKWVGTGKDRRQIRDSSEAPFEWMKLEMRAAEEKVKSLTGFTPAQLLAKKIELGRRFKGQTEAPFRVVLDPQAPKS